MQVFDGLFPPAENEIVMTLLFDLITWHGLAKLRLHTDITLRHLDYSCVAAFRSIRIFIREICDKHVAEELDKEARIREKRAIRRRAAGVNVADSTPGKKIKTLNINTYKVHRMPDYSKAIRRFGTIEGFSSWRVSS